jgi:Domain of unknown function (DUF4252)
MKMRVVKLLLACFLLPSLAAAQDATLTLPDFRSLAEKATETVNISLGPWLLHTMGAFMDDKDPDTAATKQLLAGIKSIEIHSFQFGTDLAYSSADIESVRRQLSAPGWSQLMRVRDSKSNENVDMYISIDNDRTNGFALIASKPREFTIINIVGSIKAEDLPKLEKQLHLPQGISNQTHLLM